MKNAWRTLGDLLYLLRFIWREKKGLYLLSCLQIAANAVNGLVGVLFLKFFIDELMGARRVGTIVLYVVLMCAATWLCGSLNSVCMSMSGKQKVLLQSRFVEVVSSSAEKMPYAELEKPWTKDLLELSKDAGKFIAIIDTIVALVSSLISILSLTTVIAVAAPVFFLPLAAFLVLELIMSFFMQLLMNKDWREHVIGAMRQATYSSSLLSNADYGKEIRVNVLQDWLYERSNKKYWEYVTHAFRTSRKGSVFVMAQTLLLGGVVFFSLYQIAGAILGGRLELSSAVMALSAAISLAGVGDQLMGSTSALMQSAIYVRGFRTCVELGSQPEREGGCVPFPSDEAGVGIEFSHVYFRYPSAQEDILHDFSLTIAPRESVALVGLNGAGKTTVVKLLCRLYRPDSGEIRINGVNIEQIDEKDYEKNISAVFQDYKIFAFSLRENILLNHVKNEEELQRAVEKSGLLTRIERLEKGLDTSYSRSFDEQGVEFSGGEGQKIALARAYYKNAPIVFLDEPTAALDAIAEYEIYQSFHSIVRQKTTILISHRLASTRFCDRICVMKAGEIVEEGTHAQLLKRPSGVYAQMFYAQASQYMEMNETGKEGAHETDI